MYKMFLERFCSLIISLILSTMVVFMVMYYTPGDPISILLKTPSDIIVDKEIRDNKIETLKEEYGLNDPLAKQYVRWLNKVLHLDFGQSFLTRENISDAVARTLPPSIILAIVSTAIELIIALYFGVVSALKYGKRIDRIIRFFCILLKSIPFFAICIMFLTFFSTKLFLYEISSEATAERMILPALLVGITLTPKLIRLIRVAVLDELGKIYIMDAASKGYSSVKILLYALRNAMLPIVTAVSISFAGSVGGMVITESIFSWPGIGNYALNAVIMQDYFAVEAYILIVISFVLILNFISDIAYILLNPKLRRGVA